MPYIAFGWSLLLQAMTKTCPIQCTLLFVRKMEEDEVGLMRRRRYREQSNVHSLWLLSPFAGDTSPFESNSFSNLSKKVNLRDVICRSAKSMRESCFELVFGFSTKGVASGT